MANGKSYKEQLKKEIRKFITDVKTKGFWRVQLMNAVVFDEFIYTIRFEATVIFIFLTLLQTDKNEVSQLLFRLMIENISYFLGVVSAVCATLWMVSFTFTERRFKNRWGRKVLNVFGLLMVLELSGFLKEAGYQGTSGLEDSLDKAFWSLLVYAVFVLLCRLSVKLFLKRIGNSIWIKPGLDFNEPLATKLELREAVEIYDSLASFIEIDGIGIEFSSEGDFGYLCEMDGDCYVGATELEKIKVSIRYSWLKTELTRPIARRIA